MCVLGWRSQQKVSSEETHKGAETCLPDDFISFSWLSTGAPEILLNITPILRNFYWLRQCEGHTESLLVGSGMSTQLVPLGKQKAMLMFAMRQGKFLPLLQMPADRIKKTKLFERNFECQNMDKKVLSGLKAF